MKISVVIPFYNTNYRYFERMIQSLFQQNFNGFEVIIIDDGSDESYVAYLDSFDFHNLKVKIIHQKNKGLPGARNTGIKNSTGDYIIFVDSDDILPKNMLQEAASYLNDYNYPDVIFGRMVYYKDSKNSIEKITKYNCAKVDLDGYFMSLKQNDKIVCYYRNKEIDKIKLKLLHQDNDSILLGSSSANVYKRKIVNNVLFDESIRICEDQIFNRMILNSITSCLIVPNEWYDYIQYNQSMIHDQAREIDVMKTFSYWNKIAEVDKKENTIIRHNSNIHNIGLICDEIKKMALSKKKYRDCKNTIKLLYQHPIIKQAITDTNLNNSSINKIKLFLFKNKLTKILFYLYTIKN